MKNITYVTILVALFATACSTLPEFVGDCPTKECEVKVLAREDRRFQRAIEAEEAKRMARLCWEKYQQAYNKDNGRCVGVY